MLAQQLLESVPKAEIDDLVRLLQYFNRFAEHERVKAMRNGSVQPADRFLEEEVKGQIQGSMQKTAAQFSYVTTNQNVCRCCGR
jgi:hypothetical protein